MLTATLVFVGVLGQWEMPAGGGAAPGVCPGTGEKRVWYACMGSEFETPTEDEIATGIRRGNQVCCTPEYDFECLCCLDFKPTAQMDFSRCGQMDLDSAQAEPGSPLAMEDDAALPGVAHAAANPHIIVVCTADVAVGALAADETAGPTTLPIDCISREFTVGELTGVDPDPNTGMPLQPGQALLDERIGFLMDQGIPGPSIPTCMNTFATCPAGTPLAGQAPNSAGQDALAAATALYEGQKNRVTLRGARRSGYGETFSSLAAMNEKQLESFLGKSKIAMFLTKESAIVRMHAEKISTSASGFVLTGEGKELTISKDRVQYSDGKNTVDVDPTTSVIAHRRKARMGRRGGGAPMGGGSFSVGGASNTAGNDF